MITTEFGNFDGDSWEELCQQVYKRRYPTGYQEMVASPGDWGIEGYVRGEGIAIQCYCPDKLYNAGDLHSKLVNKITKDLHKLLTYKDELFDRIGNNQDDIIKYWIFITPNYEKNEILKHLIKKEKEVIGWDLKFISPNFKVLINTADDYLEDITLIQSFKGEKLILSNSNSYSIDKIENPDDYSKNIYRKNKVRCTNNGDYNESKHYKLNEITKEKFIFGDQLIRAIEIKIPEIYQIIAGVINQYESEVEELCCTWYGVHAELIEKVRTQLRQRLMSEDKVNNSLSSSDINEIVDHMVSKWIALCPLEIE